jgi:GH25 family lysozyme M1 (1,4-beta-N-acetylmuramidase)
MMPLAIDISNWGGQLTLATVAKWKAAGVQKVIVGVDAGNIELARDQACAVTNNGLELGAYRFMYWAHGPAVILEAVRVAMNGLPLSEVWIDFEDTNAPRSSPAAVRQWITDCMARADALWPGKVGIYTAAWWWNPWTANWGGMAHYPLWVAQYDGVADLSFKAFGGWTSCRMKQYQGTIDFCGYSVDLNCYQEITMEEELKKRLDRRELLDKWAGWIQSGDDALIKKALAEMQYVEALAGASG